MSVVPVIFEILWVLFKPRKEKLEAAGKSIARRSLTRALQRWRLYRVAGWLIGRKAQAAISFADFIVMRTERHMCVTGLVTLQHYWMWLFPITGSIFELKEATTAPLSELVTQQEGCETLIITTYSVGWWATRPKIQDRVQGEVQDVVPDQEQEVVQDFVRQEDQDQMRDVPACLWRPKHLQMPQGR